MTSTRKQGKFRVFGAENAEPTMELLQDFVPLNELSSAHLCTAVRLAKLLTVPQEQTVADPALLQSHYLYLVSGKVKNIPELDITSDDWSQLSLDCIYGLENIVVAKTDCQVLLIEKASLDSMLCWDQVAKSLLIELCKERDYDEDRDWIETLLMSNLFHKIPPFNIRQIIDRFEPRVVGADEVIIREGEQGNDCYIIKEGTAIVTVYDENIQADREVAVLQAGQCFGEDALVNRTLRNATVRMIENGVLMALKKRDFLSLMTEPAMFAVPFEQAVAKVQSGACWLDVRFQSEFEFDSLPGAFHLPMHLMVLKSRIMDPDKQYYAICGTGRRASIAAYLLQQRGFNVVPVKNGLQGQYEGYGT